MANATRHRVIAAISVVIMILIVAFVAWAGEPTKASDTTPALMVAVIGALLVILNGMGLYIMAGMRADMKDIWDRMYNHEHTIDCDNADCAKKTNGVLVLHGGK